ncbi:hypothetical protein [Wolbachia endosymbiont (group A) of Agelastica alni]|uniref:hypothetical protein n=1 Tax=Wolbachia endosymbiont (group A) of Agelastica alni TaxID=3066130 RepID=UPI003132C6B1
MEIFFHKYTHLFQCQALESRQPLRHTAAVSLDPANKQRDDEMPPRTVIPRFIRGIS